ncbi:MAG: S41 family peptidase [Proteobacteria bacterium]|nr:S41 family peptidase [Pseudomonadota bacterium]
MATLASAALIIVGVVGCGVGDRSDEASAVVLDSTVLDVPTDVCDRVIGGPPGDGPRLLGASRAHATVRFFAPVDNYVEVDQALVAALSDDSGLAGYAAQLPAACAVDATIRHLRPARVWMLGPLAVVRPGPGPVQIPQHAEAVAIDLRWLAERPGLKAALSTAGAAVFPDGFAWPAATVRTHAGYVDEVWRELFGADLFTIYEMGVGQRAAEAVAGTADRARPVAVVTGARLAPTAARFAGAVRIAGQAYLLGASVPAQVAESDWVPVGRRGLAVRTRELLDADGQPWPDEIPTDVIGGESVDGITSLPGAPSPMDAPPATRAPFVSFDPLDTQQDSTVDRAVGRAGLLTLHGAARLFYPHMAIVGADFDAALHRGWDDLDGAEPLSRDEYRVALARLTSPLRDGHVILRDFAGSSPPSRALPFVVEHVAGAPVIAGTAADELRPGDTVLSVGGRPVAEIYAELAATMSAATESNRLYRSGVLMARGSGPTDVEVRGIDGVVRVETVPPVDNFSTYYTLLQDMLGGPSGWLEGPARNDLYYVNFAEDSVFLFPDNADVLGHLQAAQSARGIILDLRDYPGYDVLDGVARVIGDQYLSPQFAIPNYLGPGAPQLEGYSWSWPGPPPGTELSMPAVLLVGPATISRTETMAQALVGAGRVTVVGLTTAATNGDITGVELPGRLGVTFTGTETRNVDGSVFYDIGVPLDVMVPRTASALAAGLDLDIEAAVEVLDAATPTP